MKICDMPFEPFENNKRNERFKKYLEKYGDKSIFLSNNARRSYGLPFLRKENKEQLVKYVMVMIIHFISIEHQTEIGLFKGDSYFE